MQYSSQKSAADMYFPINKEQDSLASPDQIKERQTAASGGGSIDIEAFIVGLKGSESI